MRLYFRLIWIMIAALFRNKEAGISNISTVRLRVMPWDCVWRFVGNDRYHAFFDLGRVDLAIRLGFFSHLLRNKWTPHLISCHVKHCRKLGLFQTFQLVSYVVGCNSRFIWIGHRMESKGNVVCYAVSKLAATSAAGWCNPLNLFHLYPGERQISYALDDLDLLNRAEDMLRTFFLPPKAKKKW